MGGGEVLTKLTIWIAVAGYFAGAIIYALAAVVAALGASALVVRVPRPSVTR